MYIWTLRKPKFVGTESRLVVVPALGGSGGGEGHKVQTFSYKMSKLWRPKVQRGDCVNCIVCLKVALLREQILQLLTTPWLVWLSGLSAGP